MVWWPARAVLGDLTALVAVLSAGVLLLGAAITLFSARFGDHAIAAAGVSDGGVTQRRRQSGFQRVSPRGALRRKEWTLLRRDPWLASQTLMQLLYLLPPGLMLWAQTRLAEMAVRLERWGDAERHYRLALDQGLTRAGLGLVEN